MYLQIIYPIYYNNLKGPRLINYILPVPLEKLACNSASSRIAYSIFVHDVGIVYKPYFHPRARTIILDSNRITAVTATHTHTFIHIIYYIDFTWPPYSRTFIRAFT